MRFADILSKSNHPNQQVSEKHKIWAQEIVALLYEMELKNISRTKRCYKTILWFSSFKRGKLSWYKYKAPDYFADSIWDISYDEFSKEILKVPGSNDKHFFVHKSMHTIILINHILAFQVPHQWVNRL